MRLPCLHARKNAKHPQPKPAHVDHADDAQQHTLPSGPLCVRIALRREQRDGRDLTRHTLL